MKRVCLSFWLSASLALWVWGEPTLTVEALLRSAQQLRSESRLDEALEKYRQVLSREPTSITALYNLGWICNEQRKYESAVTWLKRGCELDPSHASMWCELAFAYYKLANIESSIQSYRRASELNQESSAPWVGLGDVQYELRKDSQAAIQAYLKALELGSKSALVKYRLGWSYNDLGEFEKAIPYLQQASELEPRSPGVWLEWGYALLRTSRYDQAVTALKQAVLLDPNLRLGHLYLGRAYILMGNLQGASGEIQALQKIDVESARQLESEIRKAGLLP